MQSAFVAGTAKAKNDDYLPESTKNQHTLIPFGAKAFLEKPATKTLAVVEIQNESHGGSDVASPVRIAMYGEFFTDLLASTKP